jgi:epsilon-lactone hydrolase
LTPLAQAIALIVLFCSGVARVTGKIQEIMTMSVRAKLISFVLRHTLKRQMASFNNPLKLRAQAGTSFGRIPVEVTTESVDAGGVGAQWVNWQSASSDAGPGDAVVLYFHGGGYVFGGLDSHRGLAWRLARQCSSKVLVVDYRLAPEHVYPAAVEDAIASYQWLLAQNIPAAEIVVAGDSAGGGLCVALLVQLKKLGLPRPKACVLFSPWTDLTLSGASIETNAKKDAMLSPAALQRFRDLYLGEMEEAGTPLASPLFADLSGLPETCVFVGSEEVLFDDSKRLVERLNQAGVQAKLSVWAKMPHVFPLLAPFIPEGDQAIEEVASFLAAHR